MNGEDGARKSKIVELPIADIVEDQSVLPRIAAEDNETLECYVDIKRRLKMKPVLVVFDGKKYWLADGTYRNRADRKLGTEKIECEIVEGTKDDAIWYATGANAKHGLPLTKPQKRKAVDALLRIAKFARLTDTRIADHVGCTLDMMNTARKAMVGRMTKANKELAAAGRKEKAIPERKATSWFKDGKFVEAGTEGAVEVTRTVRGGTGDKSRGGRKTKAQEAFLEKSRAKDKAGKAIPEWLRDTAADACKIDTFCTELSLWVAKIEKFKAVVPAGRLIDMPEIRSSKEIICNTLQAARFWACCPDCIESGKVVKDCRCGGGGWFNREGYEAVKFGGGK